MINWNNLDTLTSFKELSEVERVNLAEVMSGENGAERVKDYSVSMTEDLTYNYAAKAVDDKVLAALAKLAKEAQLTEKYAALYNGEVINTGEKRLVLHQLTRGQLGDKVEADGVDKREFYVKQQQRIADFANKVHAGEITNAAGEKFTTVVQIGIGGSDLGPRAMYLALENWAKKNGTFKMEAKFISNVDPDDAAAVLNSIDVAHSIFVLVSKSGTTLETLTNESFVKDALKNAGLDASKHMIAVTSETSPLAKSDDYLAAFFMDDYIGGRYSSTSAVGGAVLFHNGRRLPPALGVLPHPQKQGCQSRRPRQRREGIGSQIHQNSRRQQARNAHSHEYQGQLAPGQLGQLLGVLPSHGPGVLGSQAGEGVGHFRLLRLGGGISLLLPDGVPLIPEAAKLPHLLLGLHPGRQRGAQCLHLIQRFLRPGHGAWATCTASEACFS